MCSYNLNGLTIEVDGETAELLESDEQFRKNYETAISKIFSNNTDTNNVAAISQEFSSNTDTNNDQQEITNSLVWTSKKSSSEDVEATILLLNMRKKFSSKFDDQKHPKIHLWQEIANHLNSKKFFVGEGIDGAERCRKKFSNLQATYVKYKDKKHQTGEGKVLKPPFLEEMEEIFQYKDKFNPPIIIDSIKTKHETSTDTTIRSDNKNCPSSSKENLSPSVSTDSDNDPINKFQNIRRSTKPDRDKLLSNLIEVQKKDIEERRSEFGRIMSFLETTSNQRHEQIMALLKNKESKKRKRHDSDSSG